MATLCAAENFGLLDRGAIETGMLADALLLDDFADTRATKVIKTEQPVDAARLAERTRVDLQRYGADATVRFKDRRPHRPRFHRVSKPVCIRPPA